MFGYTCAPTVSETETVSDRLASAAFIDDKVAAFCEHRLPTDISIMLRRCPKNGRHNGQHYPCASLSRLIWPVCRSLATASSATNCLRFDHAMNWLEKSIAVHSISFVSIAELDHFACGHVTRNTSVTLYYPTARSMFPVSLFDNHIVRITHCRATVCRHSLENWKMFSPRSEHRRYVYMRMANESENCGSAESAGNYLELIVTTHKSIYVTDNKAFILYKYKNRDVWIR